MRKELPASILSIDCTVSNGAAVRRDPMQTARRVYLRRPQELAPIEAHPQHRGLHHRAVESTGLIRLLLNNPRLVEYLPGGQLGLFPLIITCLHFMRRRCFRHFLRVYVT